MKPGETRATNPHLLTGAHALGALSAAERAEFEAHLNACPGCTTETAGLTEAAARLGGAVNHVVPTALRPEVMQAVRRARQVPPTPRFERGPSRRQSFDAPPRSPRLPVWSLRRWLVH